MKNYTSEINILKTMLGINNRMFKKQYIKDWKYNSETQKSFLVKQDILCDKVISLWGSLYN